MHTDDAEYPSPERARELMEGFVAEVGKLRKFRSYPEVGRRVFTLQMDTINLCNLQCKECLVHTIRDVVTPIPMPRETLHKVAEQVFPYCDNVNFAARAEPWMSPDIEEAIDLARAQGVPFLEMISNGQMLNEKRARKLIDVQFDRINISTDAATQETYTEVRGSDFSKVVNNIAMLRDLKKAVGSDKPQIKFNFVMLKQNLHEMVQMVELAHELGSDMIDFRLPFLLKRQHMDDEMPTCAPELMDEMIEKARTRMGELGLAIEQLPETNAERRLRGYRTPAYDANPGPREDGTTHCDAPWGFLVIWPTGEVHPCCSPYLLGGPSMGGLKNYSFEQIIMGPRHSKLRKSLVDGVFVEECAKCKVTDYLSSNELNPSYHTDTGPRLPIAGTQNGNYAPK
jgi:MoaA/NifB/PqqE/SkfB family radical SAM enzyme